MKHKRRIKRIKDAENQVKTADLEHLGNYRRQRGNDDAAVLRLDLFGGEHEYAQADAANVLDASKVPQQRHDRFAPELPARAPRQFRYKPDP